LLHADVADAVKVNDKTRADATGMSLSTGRMIAACVRNVFTISRVSDADGFADSAYVHYGQAFRLGASPALHDRPLYLYSNHTSDTQEAIEGACMYPRAGVRTHWRALRTEPASDGDSVVPLRAALRLQNVDTGQILQSDSVVRMNSYGNEWRVFSSSLEEVDGAGDSCSSKSSSSWSFVDSRWAEGVVEAARAIVEGTASNDEQISALGSAACITSGDGYVDPGELLRDPVRRADHELQTMESKGGAVYAVLAQLYPKIRRAGMHEVRHLRRMCMAADVELKGYITVYSFQGILSFKAFRVKEEEMQQLATLFETAPASGIIDYRRFFKLMAPTMAPMRIEVVKDAYALLQKHATAGFVEVPDLQKKWNPQCHPEVQRGEMTSVEAKQDFLQQWQITSAEGHISWEEFLDYYQDVSAAVEDDSLFVELVRRAWGL